MVILDGYAERFFPPNYHGYAEAVEAVDCKPTLSEFEFHSRVQLRNMKKLIALAVLLTASMIPSAKGQTKLSGTVAAFDYRGLGYSLPVVDFGVGLDKSFGSHFEIDTFGSYEIAHKQVLGNGHEILATVIPIIWIDRTVGITGEVIYAHLYTSAYDKGTFLPESISQLAPSAESFIITPGVVFRTSPAGLPSRMWLNAIIPTGSINRTTGIESNRESGVQFTWEADMYNVGPFTMRAEIEPSYLHGYSQSNPICDGTDPGPVTCPRQGWSTYSIGLAVKFVWPRDTNKVW